jgi:serine/threonine protein kinase/tetratricopeptide (TPR) repeat protein
MTFIGKPAKTSARTGRPAPRERGPLPFEDLLEEFVDRWKRGESPRASEYLDQLDEDDAVDLIYQEFHLREAQGEVPEPADFLRRYARFEARLKLLLGLHVAGVVPDPEDFLEAPIDMPIAGDCIGPYHLLRLMGQGGFARVFLAEDRDLEDRLVVVKVSERPSTEPRLLARARHRNVVDVLRAGEAEGGQLHWVCMPFLGGATLADVLARRRCLRSRPSSGQALLDLLDAVAAPECPPPGPSRPARALLASLTYPKAVAWMFARLAEALAHAYRREVTHGDIKPSNVLLTADAEPMLLDFNLAVHWRSATAPNKERESGTLAYMAPERLKALLEPGTRPIRPRDRHAADIYALGLVLLEALGGEPPIATGSRRGSTREVAKSLVQVRSNGYSWRREARAVPPSLRPILERCLAPDPADRYTSAAHLAEDLDLWRTDRTPIHTAAPPLGHELRRWLRRRRAPLAAAALILGAGFVSAAVVWNWQRDKLLHQARAKIARIWQSPELSGVRYRLPGRWTPVEMGDPVKLASQRLALYDVLGPNDWREREDVQVLSPSERDDLEAYNMEHVLRLAKALEARSGSEEDLRRALDVLERAAELQPAKVFLRRASGLRKRLQSADKSERDPRYVPGWLEDYLEGIEHEDERPVEARDDLRQALHSRPNILWPQLRLAHLELRLGEKARAIELLGACARHRPGTAWLHNELSVEWLELGRLEEALDHANRAVSLDPDLEIAYRNRLKVFARLGHAERVKDDLSRFESLTSSRGRSPGLDLRIETEWSARSHFLLEGLTSPIDHEHKNVFCIQSDYLSIHAKSAIYYQRSGNHARAIQEWDAVLRSDPQDLDAYYGRAIERRDVGERAGEEDLVTLYRDPRLSEFLVKYPHAIQIYWMLSFNYLKSHRIREAIWVGEEGLKGAALSGRSYDQGLLHYVMASAWGEQYRQGREETAMNQVIRHLNSAFNADPNFITHFTADDFFASLQDSLDGRLLTQEQSKIK